MDFALDLVEAIVIFGVFWIIIFIPFPGVDAETEIEVQDQSYDVTFLDGHTLPEGDYTGSHNIVNGDIRLATDWVSTIQFVSTCSHEVRHLKFELEQPELDTSEEHEIMSGLGASVWPWNWQRQCIALLPARFGIVQ